jgi:7-keto-8-aminopelargonate synthetase-like enzyme
MTRIPRAIELIDDAVSDALAHGVLQLQVEDEPLDGRTIRVGGRRLLQFASCSYLGLELDPRMREGVAAAVARYGTQFSSSRSYLSAPAYEELEALLERIFEAPVVVSSSTTLGHLSALPVLVEEDDAVIMDHQVHQSVQLATAQLRLQGNPVELVRHGHIDLLEEKVRELASSHRRVWYLGDGVYSMYGDFAPVKALSWLLSRYEQLHLYVDDAHGMSWTGRHGRGFAAQHFAGHERVVIAVSLNKSFAAAGGAIVLPSEELRRKVRNCGPTLMFGGPIQPPMLGAAVASARIHLSPEIDALQAELRERLAFTNRTALELDLPLVSDALIPIRYIGTGVRAAAYDMTARLLERGFCMNPAAFPAVGSRRAGVRFTITRHLREEDIRTALEAISEQLPASLASAGLGRDDVNRAFGLARTRHAGPRQPESSTLSLLHAQSISELDAEEWDACLGERGMFDAATLAMFEDVFGSHQPPESRWSFHYFVVRDATGNVVLATFFTDSLWKDDLLAAASVSEEVERRRMHDPYFLTSRTLSMGSLLTEGDHLFLDRKAEWRGALQLLFAALEEAREECEASSVVLRDLSAEDDELAGFLADADFLRLPAPETFEIDVQWRSRDEYLEMLSRRARRFHRRLVIPMEDAWQQEIVVAGAAGLENEEWAHLQQLYRNVQERHLALNTFPLPSQLLPQIMKTPGWELLRLRLRPEHGGSRDAATAGFALCHAGATRYDWLLVGMDYRYAESFGLYPQLMSRVLRRAEQLERARVGLGLGSAAMKRRFGAEPLKRAMYVQSVDRYNRDVLELVASDATRRR